MAALTYIFMISQMAFVFDCGTDPTFWAVRPNQYHFTSNTTA